MKDETKFLGLTVGRSGIKVGKDRTKMIKDWPVPKYLTEVRSFLGLVQFFRRFIKDLSRIAAQLTNVTWTYSNIANWDPE